LSRLKASVGSNPGSVTTSGFRIPSNGKRFGNSAKVPGPYNVGVGNEKLAIGALIRDRSCPELP
jgi:hypothetical protein